MALCLWEPLAPPAQHIAASVRFAFVSSGCALALLMQNLQITLLWLLSFNLFVLLQPVGTFPTHPFRPHAGPGPQEDLQDSGILADTGTLS